ncbi:MAG: UDP-2,3-diacylglucosamine diphosphatase, partial [Pseudomonadota bacterium]|nr:UDP-2,3-diacylglucosamine diphosphatase [Pseudomonadota bacterium]
MNDLPNQFDAAHKVASFPSIRPSVPERTTGERRKFRTIWISDVHLGTKGCNHELL